MNTRTKIAASGLLIAALAASATPAFASNNSNAKGKVSGHSRLDDGARHNGGPLATLVTAGTITQATADAVETATRTAMQTAKTTNFNAGLAALVANNTITQALADAAKASVASSTGKPGHADLSAWTAAQRTALHTWLEANKVDGAAVRTAALAKLVTAGTITQAQSDAITAAFLAAPSMLDDKGGQHKGHGKGIRGGHGSDDTATVSGTITPIA